MRRQLTADLTIDFDDHGSGVAVVLLHAFPLSRLMWRPQLEGLASAARLIAPDLRGFGGTTPFSGPASVERMADDVAALLDALALKRVVLGGLSMGGYVALAFARKHADRLLGLILADTRAEADSAEAKGNRDKTIAFARTHAASDVLEQLLPKLVSGATRQARPEVIDEVRRIAAAQTPAGIIGALEALRDRPDSSDLLPTLNVPALVIVGSDDVLTPPALADAMLARLPQARLEKIPGAGHLANLEQPEAFNQAIRSFLATIQK